MFAAFKKLVCSRTAMILLGLLILVLIIWFIFPYLGFHQYYPFEPVSYRLMLILWCLVAAIFLCLQWTMVPCYVLGGLLLFWFCAPQFSFFGLQVFAAPEVRGLVIALVVVLYLLYGMFLLIRKLRRDPVFASKILQPAAPEVDQSKQLRRKVQEKLQPILKALKRERSRWGAWQRFLTAKDAYLYDIPWYWVMGSGGNGKTTLIANARIPFVLPEQAAESADYTSIDTPRPTDLCTFWLTNEAVLVDVSGQACLAAEGSEAEQVWQMLLRQCYHLRPKNAVNGVMLTVSVSELLHASPAERLVKAAHLKARLQEMRQQWGIVFPIYVLITQMDQLPGFEAYFRTLTTELRDQVFGFTLPYEAQSSPVELSARLQNEMDSLQARCEQGLSGQLQDEMQLNQRQALFLFPSELEALNRYVLQFLQALLVEADRFTTENHVCLRGVYYVSAAQSGSLISAIEGRVQDAWIGYGLAETEPTMLPSVSTHRSYFIHDVLRKVVFSESGLVRPNRRWEYTTAWGRRLLMALMFAIGLWGSMGLYYSYEKNQRYLELVQHRTTEMREKIGVYVEDPRAQKVPLLLDWALMLPQVNGWDMTDPPVFMRYGLYAAPVLMDAAKRTYYSLLDRLLLTYIHQNIELSLQQAISEQDFHATSNALSTYLMLHDSAHTVYNRQQIRHWVLRDWMLNNRGEVFSNAQAMYGHVQRLLDRETIFIMDRPVQARLVQDARRLLGHSALPVRLYERLVDDLEDEVPPSFSLFKVIGPKAGLTFRMRSGSSLEKGVAGLYTQEAYHTLFLPRLKDSMQRLVQEDQWLMGLTAQDARVIQEQTGAIQKEVQKIYLQDYTSHWQEFLEDIDVLTGNTIAYDLNILSEFVGATSPLNTLAPALVQQLTLARQPEDTLESALVDQPFMSLKEMLIPQAEKKPGAEASGGNDAAGLGAFQALLVEYYNYLSMTNTQLNTVVLPEHNDITMRMLLEARHLPAPLAHILESFVTAGAQKISHSKGNILRKVAQTQLTDMLAVLQSQVTDVCDSTITGRFPFAESRYEVAIEDFNKVFSSTGSIERFFKTYLEKYTDTTQRPWRYKSPQQFARQGGEGDTNRDLPISDGLDHFGLGYSPSIDTELALLLAQHGPDPESFAQAKDIQSTFFQDPGSHQFGIHLNYRIEEVDAAIVELVMQIDGQTRRYVHEPVREMPLTWPGTTNGTVAEIIARPMVRMDTSSIRKEGAWALFRLIEAGKVVESAQPDQVSVVFDFDSRKALLRFRSPTPIHPFALERLQMFSCPRAQ